MIARRPTAITTRAASGKTCRQPTAAGRGHLAGRRRGRATRPPDGSPRRRGRQPAQDAAQAAFDGRRIGRLAAFGQLGETAQLGQVAQLVAALAADLQMVEQRRELRRRQPVGAQPGQQQARVLMIQHLFHQVTGLHQTPPRISRSRFRAWNIRVFTVPTGQSAIAAISWYEQSSK